MTNDCCSQPTPCIHNQDVRWRDKIIDESVARVMRANLTNVACGTDLRQRQLLQFFLTATSWQFNH